MSADPLVIYVPGMRPKPEPAAHREALLGCLTEGLRRIEAPAASALQQNPELFEVISWTFGFYGEHRDIELDRPAIDGIMKQPKASVQDIQEAHSPGRRITRVLYRAADYMPFLIPHFANERMELHLNDLRRYVTNRNDVAEQTRELLKEPLIAAADAGRPILLLAHSMGSVISLDSLWQLSRMSVENVSIDLFVTMGSPLGQRYIQRRLLGSTINNERRYPDNIRRWINIGAVGDLTAVDPFLRNDYSQMVDQGLVEDIQDLEFYSYYRDHGHLNVHAEYGYLISEVTASVVSEWWGRYS